VKVEKNQTTEGNTTMNDSTVTDFPRLDVGNSIELN